MTSDGETGGGATLALLRKLQHPLAKIRARALRSLLFKLRARLVGPAALEAHAGELAPRLLAALREPALELDALHALELLVAADSTELLAALQEAGAVAELQRASINKAPEVEAAYEKLLQKLLVTPHATSHASIQVSSKRQQAEHPSNGDDESAPSRLPTASQTKRMQPWTRELPELEARGWRFAPVHLSAMDDQHLFELEVKLTLRTTLEDMVAICQEISRKLLRDFPPEVFLQRPAILEYLLHLVRQPLLSSTTGIAEDQDGKTELPLDRAMEVSLGVNYFDAIGSSTYSNKRGNLTGAVLMSAITAIESFLAALDQATIDSINPTLVIDESTIQPSVEHYADSYDHRRYFYPRSIADSGGNRTQADRFESGAIGFSFAGAVYKIFMSLLPLVRVETHPRLHILNVMHTCVRHLAEKEMNNSKPTDEPNPLDKQRLEMIFHVLSDVCRPQESNQAPLLIQWRSMELGILLLQLHPGHMYSVSDGSPRQSVDIRHDARICIPTGLWHAIKAWVSNPISLQISDVDYDKDDVIKVLSSLDSSIPSFVRLKQVAQQDVDEMESFVASSRHNAPVAFAEWPLSSAFTCENALKVLNAAVLWKQADATAIASGVAFAVWKAASECKDPSDSNLDLERMRSIVSRAISLMVTASDKAPAAIGLGVFDKLTAVFDSDSKARAMFISSVVSHRPVLSHLLWSVLAMEEQSSSEFPEERLVSLWGVVSMFAQESKQLEHDRLVDLRPLVPSLQLLAYHESMNILDQKFGDGHSTRSRLAELLNRIESEASVCERLLLISRCLLHNSPLLRTSAASGIRRVLSRDLQVSMSSTHEGSRNDPFVDVDDDVTDLNASWEAKLVELALPSGTSDQNSLEQSRSPDLSSHTRKLAQLYKIVRTTTHLVQQSALKELNLMVETAPQATIRLLEELGETGKMFQLCHDVIAGRVTQENEKSQQTLFPFVIRLLRNILFQSEALRNKARSSADFLRDLLPLVFDSHLTVRVYMYYIVLLLTCSVESLIEHNLDGVTLNLVKNRRPEVPELVKGTFGLYGSRWSRCGVPVMKVEFFISTFSAAQSQVDSNWLQSVQAIVTSGEVLPARAGGKEDPNASLSKGNALSGLTPEYDFIVDKLQSAPSHGKFLNAVYHLSMLCHASRAMRQKVAQQWESIFERYISVEPKSTRDEVIVGAVLHIVTIAMCEMSRSDQLHLILTAKRAFLPLLQRSKTTFFAQELARLLLCLSQSKVADLFPSLVVDTNIVGIVCTNFPIYSTDPLLNVTMLQLFETLVMSVKSQHVAPGAPFHNVIRQRIVEMVSPLLTIICRHRMPGSFLHHDAFCAAVRGIVSVLRTISHNELSSGDSPIQHTDAAIVLDGSWCSRLIFHHSSAMRAMGFSVLANFAGRDVQLRMLEMAVGTASDVTESDAVRGQACNVVINVLLHFSSLSHAQQAQAAAILVHGESIAMFSAKLLVAALKSEKLLVQSSVAFTRLLLVLLSTEATLSEQFGSIADAMLAANEQFDLFPELVKTLSIMGWSKKSNLYSSNALLQCGCNQRTWQRTVLPSVLELIVDCCKLFQGSIAVFGDDHAQFLVSHTPLKYALMDLINQLNESLAAHYRFVSTSNVALGVNCNLIGLHYDALLETGRSLSLLLEKSATDLMVKTKATMDGIERQLVAALAKLLDANHPASFRMGFVGVVAPAIISNSQLGSLDIESTKLLTSSVFGMFTEISDSLLTDTELLASTKSLWQVSSALQALLESNIAPRRVIEANRGLEFGLKAIKTLFVTLRAEGGFDGKRQGQSYSRPMVLCSRASAHMNLLSALIGGDDEMQRSAKAQHLPGVLMSNWSVMKTAHVRGSPILSSALTLLENYSFANDATKSSLALMQPLANPSVSTAGEDRCILLLLCDLVLRRNPASLRSQAGSADTDLRDGPLRIAACDALSGAVLNSECCKTMIKFGAVGKIVAEVQERLKLAAQTRKAAENRLDSELLGRMLRILATLASGEEGAAAIYASSSNDIIIILQDILQSRDLNTQEFGFLFVRNMAFADASKGHSAVWEDLLPFVVDACTRSTQEAASSSQHPRLEFLADALWSLVFDNQKLKATLLGRPVLLRSLDSAASRSPSSAAAGSLLRALQLIRG